VYFRPDPPESVERPLSIKPAKVRKPHKPRKPAKTA
jgi:hypothetical protein